VKDTIVTIMSALTLDELNSRMEVNKKSERTPGIWTLLGVIRSRPIPYDTESPNHAFCQELEV